jgi:crotonobetainyl-CoA:carnitine CoA-transferase CaiB-like acyl-CoA transferase
VVSALGGRIPCGPVNTAADIAADPHVATRNMILQVDHPAGRTIGIAGSPIKLTGTPATAVVRAPLLGEHTAEVLEELAPRRGDDVPGPATPPAAGQGEDRP